MTHTYQYLAPDPNDFTPWTDWTPCSLDDERDLARGCGRGSRFRTRQAKDVNQVVPASDLQDSMPCYIACPMTTPLPGRLKGHCPSFATSLVP